MKTITKQITGVVAEYKGNYWGCLYEDGNSITMGYTSLDKAKISDPRFCKTLTDMTWNPDNSFRGNGDYDKLSLATLKKITVMTTFWVED